jgi:ABC-2 type transport system permease protein
VTPAREQPFPFLLAPLLWASRNRLRRRDRGDAVRGFLFGGIGLFVAAVLFAGSFWLTWQLTGFAELGDYLLRLGLSWLFLVFLSFLTCSGVVSALTTFFLSDDMRLLLAAPISLRRLILARFARTVVQASWMVVVFLVPMLAGIGLARCAPPAFFAASLLILLPFVVIPVAVGSLATLALVNSFPARRARELLVLISLLFVAGLIVVIRMVRPEALLTVESLPDVTDFFASLQRPVHAFLPSFWAGEALFAALQGSSDPLHLAALWTTSAALVVMVRAAHERWFFAGYSKSQESRKARFARYRLLDRAAAALPISSVHRHLLVKDAKIFFRDVSQWSQLLLLLALALVYLYNFSAFDLERLPFMSGMIKSAYAFLNLVMASLVMATVTVRFVLPAVSSEGAAFWIVRTSPVPLRQFLWSKFWTGLVPVLLLTELLTIVGNELLGADPFLKITTAVAIVFMAFALVGLGTGLGAIHPRFNAENPSQVAGSYGGVAFMIAAVLFIVVAASLLGWPSLTYVWQRANHVPIDAALQLGMAICFSTAAGLSIAIWLLGMRAGVRALERME